MKLIKCVSSQLTSTLLEWRNPEKFWVNASAVWENDILKEEIEQEEKKEIEKLFVGAINEISKKHIDKIILTEVGLCFLTLIAITETIAYATFFLIALIFNHQNEGLYKFLESSIFTVFWGIINLGNNLFAANVTPQESFVRYYVKGLYSGLFRKEDLRFGRRWINDSLNKINERESNITEENAKISRHLRELSISFKKLNENEKEEIEKVRGQVDEYNIQNMRKYIQFQRIEHFKEELLGITSS